jgi:phenylalanyl-tRNA synthetase beta chain
LRPRNNIVDITNYVMLECGQPLHAFDYALLQGNAIVVRQTRGEGKFTTLDGEEHQLPAEAVMVCDADREVSIAGIMGGANSEISENTVDVVLESACWNPANIRKTTKALGIGTDASQRFERGTDPDGVWYALQRTTQLVREIAGGEVLKGTIDVVSRRIRSREVPLRTDRINSILGTSLSTAEVVRLLGLLGIVPKTKKAGLVSFKVPSHRVDIEREIDLVEEVARVYGYDNISEKSSASVDFSHPFARSQFADEIRQVLVGFGFQEAISYSLQDPKTAGLTGASAIQVLNPQSVENSALRTSLVPGLVGAVARNQSFGNSDLRLFEIGKVYCVDESSRPKHVENLLEENRVCLLLSGMRARRHWSDVGGEYDIYDLKGEVHDLIAKIALDKSGFISYSTSNRLADYSMSIEINGSYAGYLGCVRRDLLEVFNVERPVFVAEIDLETLQSARGQKRYIPLPKYPRVQRDVAFVVAESTPAESIERIISEASSSLLQSVEVFDVYRGENIAPGTKSLAFSLELMSRERTLTETEIDAEVRNVIEAVVRRTGAALRAV